MPRHRIKTRKFFVCRHGLKFVPNHEGAQPILLASSKIAEQRVFVWLARTHPCHLLPGVQGSPVNVLVGYDLKVKLRPTLVEKKKMQFLTIDTFIT
jgi:hypothetical protein